MYKNYSNLYPELQARAEYRAAARLDRNLNIAAGVLVVLFILGVAACVAFGISLSDVPTNLG